ncbi:unnamed protein product [Prunus armeniaca]|uniref:Uncharacterized protein n=1 Tax=Prunus armeniaca TaxID=36596 RepID=A0A6J5TMH8_PRUAR|nr:unnamed protein product [Prunus armeniaca]CAB4295010.1 unnamed protein product [Prunus armeniaca]
MGRVAYSQIVTGRVWADLIYRFKRYNPSAKLNLNFADDPPPLPEGVMEEMIEDYEGEVAIAAAEGVETIDAYAPTDGAAVADDGAAS